jgi:hypothetical protein
MSLSFFGIQLLLANPPNVRDVAMIVGGLSAGRIVVAFVQAQVLGRSRRRLEAFDDYRIERPSK